MRRLAAIVAAVGMVVAALALRQALDDDDGEPTPRPGDEALVVVCDPDLTPACDALGADVEVRVEDSATTSAALVTGEADDVDAWVTSAAWLELTASRSDQPVGEASVLASSPVVLAADVDRADALRELCGDAAIWRCAGDAAGRPWDTVGGDPRWGPLLTGLPDADTAVGLSVLASVAVGFFGDPDFAANDFGDLRGWLGTLAEASGEGDRQLVRSLVRVRGTYSAGGLVEAWADRPELAVLPASPTVDAVAVLVDLPGGDRLPDLAGVREALRTGGWDAGDGDPPTLLKPGVMAALHSLWKDET